MSDKGANPLAKAGNAFELELGETAVLTFSGAKANIFSTTILKEFIEAMEAMPPKVKALVITGSGNTFVAGADIKEMLDMTPEEAMDFSRLFHRAMDAVIDLRCPVIAAVNGFALGGGCELTLASDIVIASDVAIFGQPEIGLGIIPGGGATQRLVKRVGELKAMELMLTGERLCAGDALAIGLVNKVVERERLKTEAIALARTIASKPAQCASAIKTLVKRGSLEMEIEVFSGLFRHDDRKRLMKEFLSDRRKNPS